MKDNELIDFVDWLIKSEEAPKGSSFEEIASWINDLSSTNEGKKILNQLINTYKGTSMFKNGGKLDYIFYLKSGGKCKVTKHQETSTLPGSRARGTADAHRGSVTPDYYGNEDQWTTHNGHPAMNVFDGDDLHQTVITYGQWGTPRRNRRIITNYATPNQSDTLYVDSNGIQYPKHPGILGQLGIFSDIFGLGKTHSPEYMQAVDGYLQGFEPKYLYEKEIPKHGDGGKTEPKSLTKPSTPHEMYHDVPPTQGGYNQWAPSRPSVPPGQTGYNVPVPPPQFPQTRELPKEWSNSVPSSASEYRTLPDTGRQTGYIVPLPHELGHSAPSRVAPLDRNYLNPEPKKFYTGGVVDGDDEWSANTNSGNYRWNTDEDLSKGGFYWAEPMQFRGEQVSRHGYADPDNRSAHGDKRTYSYGDYTVDDDKYGRSIYHNGVVYSDSERPTYWQVNGKYADRKSVV